LRHAAVGVHRALARLRPVPGRRSSAAVTFQRTSLSIARAVGTFRIQRPQLAADRLVSASAVALVAIAIAVSNVGAGVGTGPTGGPTGPGEEPRLAIGGAVAGVQGAPNGAIQDADMVDRPATGRAGPATPESNLLADAGATIAGPFDADGTLLKPGSVDTTVADGKALLRTYRVRAGDTLTGIANRFDVSMMTVWWANKLKSKSDLHIGQTLVIPPVSGVVVTVAANDTLESVAARYAVEATEILAVNQLADSTLVVGQTLTIPGARSSAIATPKPKPTPAASRKPVRTVSSSGSTRPPSSYTGGAFAWPVPGGTISQYFHYGHYGLDIQAPRGTRVNAAAGGTVTFAGWKSNGGGYQVWIAHGSGLYTTYNHMSSVSVGRGQHVGRGQQVGRVGATGYATGPHLHFEVWRGPIWDGGTRVNPLKYL
jgi:murein DD-endopeptidase MepM/ murein hydrolase activator NlpD